jgi:protein gp37
VSTKTGIEWTDSTWNPIRGCSRVSEGCRNCYAEKVAYRFSAPGQPYEGLVRIGADGERRAEWNGRVEFVKKHLLDPTRWREPRRIFVNSMSDLFHEGVADEWLDMIFDVMQECPQHTFQILTKRPERMLAVAKRRAQLCIELNDSAVDPEDRKMAAGFVWPLPNVWLGVSVENQKAADERIPLLLQTSAAVRFISAEPLLGPVELKRHIWLPRGVQSDLPWLMGRLFAPSGLYEAYRNPHGAVSVKVEKQLLGIKPDEMEARDLDWVIVGGESGPGARPMHPDWARSLRDQCVTAGVPFFFKQWGEWAPTDFEVSNTGGTIDGEDAMARVGKHAAGAVLDGREWREFPAVAAQAVTA